MSTQRMSELSRKRFYVYRLLKTRFHGVLNLHSSLHRAVPLVLSNSVNLLKFGDSSRGESPNVVLKHRMIILIWNIQFLRNKTNIINMCPQNTRKEKIICFIELLSVTGVARKLALAIVQQQGSHLKTAKTILVYFLICVMIV